MDAYKMDVKNVFSLLYIPLSWYIMTNDIWIFFGVGCDSLPVVMMQTAYKSTTHANGWFGEIPKPTVKSGWKKNCNHTKDGYSLCISRGNDNFWKSSLAPWVFAGLFYAMIVDGLAILEAFRNNSGMTPERFRKIVVIKHLEYPNNFIFRRFFKWTVEWKV